MDFNPNSALELPVKGIKCIHACIVLIRWGIMRTQIMMQCNKNATFVCYP